MPTKTIVIGEAESKTRPIEFLKILSGTCAEDSKMCNDFNTNPKYFEFIELICKNYLVGYDLIFAYHDPLNRGYGSLFLGKWNDGIV